MADNHLVSTVGQFVQGSSLTIDYLVEKYKQTLSQIASTIQKMRVEPYDKALNYSDDLNFILFVSHNNAKAYETFAETNKAIYIQSVSDIPKALEIIQLVSDDIDNTKNIISTFNALSVSIITKAGSMESNPDEYEFIMKSFNTLQGLFDELDKNYQALSMTIKNIGYLYQSIS